MAKRPVNPMAVLRTDWVTPHLIRVVLDAQSFVDNGCTDKYVKLMFLKPDVTYPTPIDLDEIRATMPREQWPTTRTYTVRWFDAAAGEIAIDFVYHGDEGIAAPWAAAAQSGDEILVRGPGGAYAPDRDVDWHLLVGDESALPAVSAALEALLPGAVASVFALVDDEAEAVKLTSAAEVDVTWLYRSAFDSPADANEALVEAVRSTAFRPGSVQAFVHGEAGFVADLRRHLITDRGVPRDRLSVSGYWRRGKNEDGWQAEKAETRRLEEAALS
jgi:NADPH-dependent ferric siderophore reductase